jgi:hypothetical protein
VLTAILTVSHFVDTEDVDVCVKEPCFLFIDNIAHCNQEWLKELVRMSNILLALHTKT